MFHSSIKIIASASDIVETFKSVHQSIMAKIKNYACEDWIVLDAIIKHSKAQGEKMRETKSLILENISNNC